MVPGVGVEPTSTQQELALKIFETIRFGGPSSSICDSATSATPPRTHSDAQASLSAWLVAKPEKWLIVPTWEVERWT